LQAMIEPHSTGVSTIPPFSSVCTHDEGQSEFGGVMSALGQPFSWSKNPRLPSLYPALLDAKSLDGSCQDLVWGSCRILEFWTLWMLTWLHLRSRKQRTNLHAIEVSKHNE